MIRRAVVHQPLDVKFLKCDCRQFVATGKALRRTPPTQSPLKTVHLRLHKPHERTMKLASPEG